MVQIYGGIDYSRIKEALKRASKDELHRFDSYESFHHYGLKPSDFYYSPYDIDTYWTNDGFTNPEGSWLMAYSKKSWIYPAFAIEAILPTLGPNLVDGFGLESGGRGPINLACFNQIINGFYLTGGTSRLYTRKRIDFFLPADYDSAMHVYSIKLNKCNAEAYIDDKLVGIILFGLPEAIPTWQNLPPYTLFSTPSTSMAMRTLMAIAIETTTSFTIENRWDAFQMVCNDGDPLPPRQYALYTENTSTKWNGLETDAAVTSHPVPVWGYPIKTLCFQSNAAGTLDVQVYTGGAWRTITSIALVANTLRIYNLNAEVPIARCIYTPIGADTINCAEWMLS